MTEEQTIVLINGSSSIKVGFGGEEDPRVVFPTIVGHPKYSPPGEKVDSFVGEEAKKKAGILILKNPIIHGIFQNWDDVESLWHHTFYNELHIDPSEHPVLFTEARINSKESHQKMVQIMFETFNVPSLCLEMQPVLSLYTTGELTGVVLESGDTTTSIVPIKDGRPIIDSISYPDLTGHNVTMYLQKIMSDLILQLDKWKTTENNHRINDIKKKCSYVALDYDEELQKAKISNMCEMVYKDEVSNEQITINDERFRGPELLFRPFMNDLEVNGFHQLVFESINKCDKEIQNDMFSHIFTSGGNTLFDGLPQRLEKEIKNLAPKGTNVKVERVHSKYPAFKGGSLLVKSESFSKKLIKGDSYRDVGPEIISQYYP